TSFADSLILLATLPAGSLFLAKTELTTALFLKSFIKRLGHLTITREDFRKSEKEMENIEKALREQKSLIVYPEGGFAYARGVRQFKLSAFHLAVENNLSVCPIALKGVRDILRSSEKLLRPGKIEVIIGKPMNPQYETGDRLTQLRDKARAFISRY